MPEQEEGGDTAECVPLLSSCDATACSCLQEAVPGGLCECGDSGGERPFPYCFRD
jgi:hypothetical protein